MRRRRHHFCWTQTASFRYFGDKIKAKAAAIEAGIASIPGTDGPIASIDDALEFAKQYGYPIMIKAALGGGGRGMRVAHDEKSAREGYERAKSEAKAAFGSDEVYVEKYIANPKHIEVQILGDTHGNVIHLLKEIVLFSAVTKSSRSSALCLYE